ncbi:hypothetical protein [Gordoniibacillus kamchatkensis]|uniref:hypothetical protein n=1 Tax=Gordoniibacillus kamchatkensis TaxID=1590651 RepID=UPI0012E0C402|nr:hypothetical protein [Paenibacillus sp. VKM B-2647]
MTENKTKGRKPKKTRISAPLHAVIIEPASTDGDKVTDKAFAECVKQIKELIRKDGRSNVRDLRKGIDRGTGEERV